MEGPARHLAARCAPSGWSQAGSLTRFSTIPPTPRHLPLLISPGFLLGLRILPGGQGQRCDPAQHGSKQSSSQMALRQEQPIVSAVFHQPAAGLHQPLLQAGQGPVLNPSRQHQPPPEPMHGVGGYTCGSPSSYPVNAIGLSGGVPGGGGSRKCCADQNLSVLHRPRSGPGSRRSIPQGLLCALRVLGTHMMDWE